MCPLTCPLTKLIPKASSNAMGSEVKQDGRMNIWEQLESLSQFPKDPLHSLGLLKS